MLKDTADVQIQQLSGYDQNRIRIGTTNRRLNSFEDPEEIKFDTDQRRRL